MHKWQTKLGSAQQTIPDYNRPEIEVEGHPEPRRPRLAWELESYSRAEQESSWIQIPWK